MLSLEALKPLENVHDQQFTEWRVQQTTPTNKLKTLKLNVYTKPSYMTILKTNLIYVEVIVKETKQIE